MTRGSFANLQVRSLDTEVVRSALARIVRGRGYVTLPAQGWISCYDERSEDAIAELSRVSQTLSREIGVVVVAFQGYPESFGYQLYERGELQDGGRSGDVRKEFDRLLPLCRAGTSHGDIARVLGTQTGHEGVMLPHVTPPPAALRNRAIGAPSAGGPPACRGLAELMGIDPDRALLGFVDVGAIGPFGYRYTGADLLPFAARRSGS